MVRTLIASMVMSAASIAVACPTCGCSDSKTETVAAEAKACATECATACETTCTEGNAAAMAVAGAASDSCDATCPMTGAAVMAVAADGEACASECETECATECATPCDGATSTVSFASYMPAMSYKVGEKSMACSKMAGEMASEHNTHMHYVVKGVEYDDKAQAMTAHAKQLQGMMMDLVRVQLAVSGECVACPDAAKELADSCESKTMQYRVGPATFDCAEDAIKASIMAYNAATNVKMEYAVGDDTTTCSVAAGEMASAASCSVEYVVNGQRTNCSTSASYMKTLASVQSALKALEAASKATSDA